MRFEYPWPSWLRVLARGQNRQHHEATTNLSSLVAKVEHGDEVVIARAGKPVAKLVPIRAAKKKRPDRRPGFLKGIIRMRLDFDDPLPENILAAFRGETN